MNLRGPGLAMTEFPSLTRGERSFESFIFIRDASEQILPTWERGQDRVRPAVTLMPESEELTAWLIDLLEPFDRGGRDELTELVSSFCDVLASRLVLRGEAYLEVVPEEDSDRPARLVVLILGVVGAWPGRGRPRRSRNRHIAHLHRPHPARSGAGRGGATNPAGLLAGLP